VEIDPVTFAFAKGNLEAAGYRDIVLVREDGGRGFEGQAPYDRVCMTAACADVPLPLLEQLRTVGRLIAPVIRGGLQDLVLLEKTSQGIRQSVICEVLYVSLQGEYAPMED
jgi:protein-L-isoaspartate(D-aspartate) O-methyltransferase